VELEAAKMPQLEDMKTASIPDPNAKLKGFSQVHGVTKDELVTWSESLPKNLRPSWISVRTKSDLPLFDAVATTNSEQEEWKLQFFDTGNPSDAALFEKLRFEYQIVAYSAYKEEGQSNMQAVLWGKATKELWTAWWNGSQEFIGEKIRAYRERQVDSNGVALRLLPSSLIANDFHYQLLQTYMPGDQCEAALNLGYEELLAKMDEYRAKDWRPHIVNAINYIDSPRYFAVFVDNPRSERWKFSPHMKTAEYRAELLRADSEGGRPRCVFSREENGEAVYSVVWDYPVNLKAKAPPIADDDFQAVAPFNAARAKKYQEACAAHLKLPVEYTNSIGMQFRLIPPGTFTIGSSPEQIATAKPHLHTSYESNRPERAGSEGPQRVVTLTKPFYLGTTEVTQSQFLQVVGTNPSYYSPTGDGGEKVGQKDRSNSPVENMSWLATGEFCNRLSEHEKLEWAYRITPRLITQTGTGGYRLPTEAEWEFACRAGTTLQFWCGHSDDSLMDVAWFRGNNPNGFPSEVAKLQPNPFGLYDMHGNVWEWVHDCWRPDTYENWTGPAAVDPRVDTAPEDRRVMRGGDFFLSAEEARSACRDGYPHDAAFHDAGFRVALSVDAVRQMLTPK